MQAFALRSFLRKVPSCTNLTRCQLGFRTASTWGKPRRFESKMAAASEDPFAKLAQAAAPAPKRRASEGIQNRNKGRNKPTKRKKKEKPVVEGSFEEVLITDIHALLAAQSLSDDAPVAQGEEGESEAGPRHEQGTKIEVEVVEISSTGDGLAKEKGSNHIYVVPFTVPGDTVKARAWRYVAEHDYTHADFISVVKPSPLRDDSRIQCKYFATCSGCQFQMLDYSEQLRLKRNIVVKAYKNFSQLSPELVPEVLDTIGSPLQYNYRTKLTPHFDGDAKGKKFMKERPPIGFTPKVGRKTMDIEDCPIATDAVRKGLTDERARMEKEFSKYARGATILLRENTVRVPKPANGDLPPHPEGVPSDAIKVETPTHIDYKTCETNMNGTSTEYIDDFVFTNNAGSFFQNNNSILSPFTEYIRQHVLPPASAGAKPIRTLIDAYSGSGLFTITQSSLFPGGSIGIDISPQSIEKARTNAELNSLSQSQCKFISADAAQLFRSVESLDPDETAVILDPPRKGCDTSFLRQLLQFAPKRIVYVSCNVHTQARDVGVLVRGDAGLVEAAAKEWEELSKELKEGKKQARYSIESIRGFDFFPQTGHVEGVAVLNRVDE
ncbi:S-adenosyl-L-methionine-dependent methyltransferase [Cercophora newfieldiana]|uniref:S-adenosyl-L-methionine-dependent methyltransferase n=1 Tax=Cercophora newfieldiana TaxID=92897 RepID=A0AA39XSD3_9PEZI|nr:S-adenosyl-L-methionine-dependent methyltransferase [Cercophora newfieldiana]